MVSAQVKFTVKYMSKHVASHSHIHTHTHLVVLRRFLKQHTSVATNGLPLVDSSSLLFSKMHHATLLPHLLSNTCSIKGAVSSHSIYWKRCCKHSWVHVSSTFSRTSSLAGLNSLLSSMSGGGMSKLRRQICTWSAPCFFTVSCT